MAFEFSAEAKKRFEEILIRYPDRESALLPTLHLAQKEFGHFTVERMDAIAQLLGLPRLRVYQVVSFYTMYQRQPVGKYLLQVCTNISCSLLGAERLMTHLEEKLGIKVGETTSDGFFTLCEVECLGACGNAPVMMANDDYYEDLTAEKIDALLDDLRKR
ncbi:MAG: NADH-quinone oxidoreductase subunit NuoE [bacterium]